MLRYIFFRLFWHSIISGFFGLIFGSLIGWVVGTIRRRRQETLRVSIIGSFLGCMVAAAIPPTPNPGSLESWGDAGGLGSLSVLVSLAFIALGGVVGSLILSTFGFRLALKLKTKWLLLIISGIYLAMAISLYYGYLNYCFPSSSYC